MFVPGFQFATKNVEEPGATKNTLSGENVAKQKRNRIFTNIGLLSNLNPYDKPTSPTCHPYGDIVRIRNILPEYNYISSKKTKLNDDTHRLKNADDNNLSEQKSNIILNNIELSSNNEHSESTHQCNTAISPNSGDTFGWSLVANIDSCDGALSPISRSCVNITHTMPLLPEYKDISYEQTILSEIHPVETTGLIEQQRSTSPKVYAELTNVYNSSLTYANQQIPLDKPISEIGEFLSEPDSDSDSRSDCYGSDKDYSISTDEESNGHDGGPQSPVLEKRTSQSPPNSSANPSTVNEMLTGIINEGILMSKPAVRDNHRVYDKKHACLYCKKLYVKLPQHLEIAHIGKEEVAEYMKLPKNGKERADKIRKLRNKGNYVHNMEVLKNKEGALIVTRRSSKDVSYKSYLPCEYCYGLFHKRKLWRHVRSCPDKFGKATENRRSVISNALLMTPIAPNANDLFSNNILKFMHEGQEKAVIESDPTLCIFGSREAIKHKHLPQQKNHIAFKLRLMARLIIELKKD